MRDLVKLVQGIHAYIGEAIAPIAAQLRTLSDRIDELASRAPEKGEKGEDGKDGASVSVADVAPLIAEEVAKAVEALPPATPGEKGEDGTHGKDADPLEVAKRLAPMLADDVVITGHLKGWFEDAWKGLDPRALLMAELEKLPKPVDGKDGKDGEAGKSVTLEDLAERLELIHAKWALEFERRSADRIAEIERQAQAAVEKALAAIPTPKDGVDGLSFEDLSIEHDGERKFALVAQRGERVIRKEVSLPVVLDRGFWQRGQKYEAGDGVTCGGDYWIAKRDTEAQPDAVGDDWRRAVRKGRNARGAVEADPVPRRHEPVRLGADQ